MLCERLIKVEYFADSLERAFWLVRYDPKGTGRGRLSEPY